MRLATTIGLRYTSTSSRPRNQRRAMDFKFRTLLSESHFDGAKHLRSL